MRIEKATFELTSASLKKLRDLRLEMRSGYFLPVTQRLIIEVLIEQASLTQLVKHFKKVSDREVGRELDEVQELRRGRRRRRVERKR